MDEQQWSRLLGVLSNRQYAELAEMMGRYPTRQRSLTAPPRTRATWRFWRGTAPLSSAGVACRCSGRHPVVLRDDGARRGEQRRRQRRVHRVLGGRPRLVSGKKWWITGAMHPKCGVCLFLGREASSSPQGARSSPKGAQREPHHRRPPHEVPRPQGGQALDVFGTQDPPTATEVHFDSVAVPAKGSVIFGRGRGSRLRSPGSARGGSTTARGP